MQAGSDPSKFFGSNSVRISCQYFKIREFPINIQISMGCLFETGVFSYGNSRLRGLL